MLQGSLTALRWWSPGLFIFTVRSSVQFSDASDKIAAKADNGLQTPFHAALQDRQLKSAHISAKDIADAVGHVPPAEFSEERETMKDPVWQHATPSGNSLSGS